VHSFVPKFGK